jgi:hypothetical protein
MAAVPTLEAEEARRPSWEREALVGERTRIINHMESALARVGIAISSRGEAFSSGRSTIRSSRWRSQPG